MNGESARIVRIVVLIFEVYANIKYKLNNCDELNLQLERHSMDCRISQKWIFRMGSKQETVSFLSKGILE